MHTNCQDQNFINLFEIGMSIWYEPANFGAYRIFEQRRLRRVCSANSQVSAARMHLQSTDLDADSDTTSNLIAPLDTSVHVERLKKILHIVTVPRIRIFMHGLSIF